MDQKSYVITRERNKPQSEPITEKENQPTVKFVKLSPKAFKPARFSKEAAGYDLYSAYDYIIPAKGKILVKTDLQLALPPGCYGRIAPKSGLALNHFIDVGAGVIDRDYRGNIGVLLFNFNEKDFLIQHGDRIAQLIIEKIYFPHFEEVSALGKTERNDKGFGSTIEDKGFGRSIEENPAFESSEEISTLYEKTEI